MATYRAWVTFSGDGRVAAHSLGPRSPDTGCVSFTVFWHGVLTVYLEPRTSLPFELWKLVERLDPGDFPQMDFRNPYRPAPYTTDQGTRPSRKTTIPVEEETGTCTQHADGSPDKSGL